MNFPSTCGIRAIFLAFQFLATSVVTSKAEQFGHFSYNVIDGSAVITDYPDTEVGHLEIPSVIDGFPVTEIADSAFDNVSGLTSVTIPASVKAIGDRAFYRNRLVIVHLLGDPPTLGSGAFGGGGRGFSIYVPSANQGYTLPTWEGYPTVPGGALGPLTYRVVENSIEIFRCHANEVTNVTVPSLIEDRPVTSIAYCAFAYKKDLTTVALPNSITSIAGLAFKGCQNLKSINLPDELAKIAPEMFSGCKAITELTIPDGIQSIGGLAFYRCSALASVTFPPGVTAIGDAAFFDCDAFLTVEIPSTVTSLGEGAFAGCNALTAIEVEETNPHFLSLDGVLFNADQSILLQCPAARQGSYVIPSTVTNLADRAFHSCQRLTSIDIPDSVPRIGQFTFHSCRGLISIELPSSLISIDSGAFIFSDRLVSVTIPPNVTSIGSGAFNYCSSLQSILFQGNAPHFSDNACHECSPAFTTYHFKGALGFTVPIWEGSSSSEINLESHPAAPWLLSHGLSHDADLKTEPNGEGVTLLTAYALDLDPLLPLQSQLPKAIFKPNTLSIKFHGTRPGITYLVESSHSLQDWTSTGVIISNPDSKGIRTATIDRSSPTSFLRITVLNQ